MFAPAAYYRMSVSIVFCSRVGRESKSKSMHSILVHSIADSVKSRILKIRTHTGEVSPIIPQILSYLGRREESVLMKKKNGSGGPKYLNSLLNNRLTALDNSTTGAPRIDSSSQDDASQSMRHESPSPHGIEPLCLLLFSGARFLCHIQSI